GPRDRAGAAGADAVGPARVLPRERRLERVPVVAAGEEADERLARGQPLGRVVQGPTRGPEVRVGVLVVVVEEVEEAEVALEGGAVERLVAGERGVLGGAGENRVDGARAEEAGERREMDAGREDRVDEARGVAREEPAAAPEAGRVVRVVADDAD